MNTALFVIAFLFTLSSTAFFGYTGKSVEMGIAVVVGAIAIAFANIDKIKWFKGAGFEAEMVQVIKEANVTIATLRKLATQIVEPMLTIIGREGEPFQNISNAEKFRAKERLVKSLKELGASEEQIEKVTYNFDQSFIIEHGRKVLRLITRDDRIDKTTKEQMRGIISPEKLANIDPQEIRNFLKVKDLLSEEIDEAVKDFEYFLQEREFRRPEHWLV